MTAATYDPIDVLRDRIADASRLPEAAPYVPSPDPLDVLRSRLQGEEPTAVNDDEQVGSVEQIEPVASGGIEALVGREVLDLVGSAPLPADARAEAVRRLAMAMQNPTRENVRSVLSVLVTGRADA